MLRTPLRAERENAGPGDPRRADPQGLLNAQPPAHAASPPVAPPRKTPTQHPPPDPSAGTCPLPSRPLAEAFWKKSPDCNNQGTSEAVFGPPWETPQNQQVADLDFCFRYMIYLPCFCYNLVIFSISAFVAAATSIAPQLPKKARASNKCGSRWLRLSPLLRAGRAVSFASVAAPASAAFAPFPIVHSRKDRNRSAATRGSQTQSSFARPRANAQVVRKGASNLPHYRPCPHRAPLPARQVLSLSPRDADRLSTRGCRAPRSARRFPAACRQPHARAPPPRCKPEIY